MTLATATSKKSAPLPIPTIKKERAEELTAEIFNLGDRIGQHLAEIRDSRGFQHLGYKDFITYCKTEFGYGKSRAYQLIQESQIEETLRKDSIISESERLTSSHYSALANDVSPEDRGKVLSYAKKLAEMRGKNLTALDIKAAAVTVKGGIPNKQSKWAKPLSRLGLEKGAQVVVNPGLPTSATGVIKKVREDGRLDVYLYGFNTTISYSFSDVQLAEPMPYIPLTPNECSLNQEVQIFSSRMKFSGEIGIILGRLKETAIVEVDGKQYELNYHELAAVAVEEDNKEASAMTVEVESEAVEVERCDDFNWTDWTRKWLPRMLDWLSANATDQQRLDIFSALAEKLSAQARETAIGIFGGTADGNEFAAYKYLADQKIETLEREVASQVKQIGVRLAENNQLALKLKEKQEEYYELEKELKSLRQELERVQTQTTRIEQLIIADTEDSETEFEVGSRIEVIQPEGWCEIAYANPGQTGVIQGKHKKGGYNVLLDEPPARGKRRDITLTANRMKLSEELLTEITETTESAETISNLSQQIAEQRDKLIQRKKQLEENLETTKKQKFKGREKQLKKIEQELKRTAHNFDELDLFETYKIGDTVQSNGQEGTITNLDFSPGGMPQVWVKWENGITKAEAVSSISIRLLEQSIERNQALASLEEFKKQLIPYAAHIVGAKNPYAYANTILQNISEGKPSLLYDDYLAGKPLGSQLDRPWEIQPGVNIPALEEERIQYHIHKGEPIEQATLKAREELRNPTTAQPLWEGFLRKCDRLADDAIKAQKMGVETPYLPPSFTDKAEVTKESVSTKLEQVATAAQEIIEPSKDQPPTFDQLKDSWLQGNAASKAFIEGSIEKHPEWGYKVEDLASDENPHFPFEVGDFIQDEQASWRPLQDGEVQIAEILKDSKQIKICSWIPCMSTDAKNGYREHYSYIPISSLSPSLKKVSRPNQEEQ